MPELQVALRYVVFAAFAASVLVALASWLVRTRRIPPFGALGRTLGTAGVCADRLARRADTPRAPAGRRVRLEPARRLARAVGAEASAAHHRRGVMATLVVHVVPRARRTEVSGRHGDAIKIRLAAA